MSVIHYGVDINDFPLGKGQGGYVLFLGRMNPGKGLHTAIEIAGAAGARLKIAAKCRERAEQTYFNDVIKPPMGPNAFNMSARPITVKNCSS